MNAFELTEAVDSAEALLRMFETVDLPGYEGDGEYGSIGEVHVNRKGWLRQVNKILGFLAEERMKKLNALTRDEMMGEWSRYAEGCTAECAPNPDEYVETYYPERLEEWFPNRKRWAEQS